MGRLFVRRIATGHYILRDSGSRDREIATFEKTFHWGLDFKIQRVARSRDRDILGNFLWPPPLTKSFPKCRDLALSRPAVSYATPPPQRVFSNVAISRSRDPTGHSLDPLLSFKSYPKCRDLAISRPTVSEYMVSGGGGCLNLIFN